MRIPGWMPSWAVPFLVATEYEAAKTNDLRACGTGMRGIASLQDRMAEKKPRIANLVTVKTVRLWSYWYYKYLTSSEQMTRWDQ